MAVRRGIAAGEQLDRGKLCALLQPAYDALLEQSRTELDPDKRRTLFIAMNDLLIEDAALVTLVERPTALGLSNSIVLDRGPTPWDPETWDIAGWQRR